VAPVPARCRICPLPDLNEVWPGAGVNAMPVTAAHARAMVPPKRKARKR
jgi:hypothetical protein